MQIHSSPWLLAGDFNTARFTSEKVGGKTLSFSQLSPFNDFMSKAALSNIRSVGSIWSWNNKNLDTNRIAGRLDRVLCNVHWLDAFPMAYYEYLSHSTSDHSPMRVYLSLVPQQVSNPSNSSVTGKRLKALGNFYSLHGLYLLKVLCRTPLPKIRENGVAMKVGNACMREKYPTHIR